MPTPKKKVVGSRRDTSRARSRSAKAVRKTRLNKGRAAAAEKRSSASTTKPKRSAPKRAPSRPKRVVVEAKRAVAKRVVTKPKRVVAKPKRVVAKAKRVVAKAKRVVAKAKRVVAKPKRAVAKAKRVVAKAKRVVAKAKRVVAKPKRAVAKATKSRRAVVKKTVAKPKRVIAQRMLAAPPVVATKLAPPKATAPRIVAVPALAPLKVAEPVAVPSPPAVRVGRLPPRDRGATSAPPAELVRSAPSHSAPASPPAAANAMTLPREPFRPETWEKIEKLASELELGKPDTEQRRVLRAVLEGQDVLVSQPAGLVRSASYILASRLLPQPVLVVSPRLLLLRELHDRLLQRRVPAVLLHSGLAPSQLRACLDRVAAGGQLVVLSTARTLGEGELERALGQSGVSLAVMEEAHVLASTADEQSPAAGEVPAVLARLGRPPMLASMGAATPETRHEVAELCALRSPQVVISSPVRDNVALDVIEARGEVRQRALVQLALRLRRPGIVFASNAAEVDALYGALAALRLPVHRFHEHMPAGERAGEQLNFVLPGRRSIMVATSAFASSSGLVGVGEAALLDRAPTAFGLGVEKRDIRFVVHWSAPLSLEQYARELALAGRDGEPATAVLFHDSSDLPRTEMFLTQSRITARHLTQTVKALEPAAIDGHARTLESVALASGLSRRLSEGLVAILEDATLVQHVSGWVKPLVSARALAERSERLGLRLDKLRSLDARRARAVATFAGSQQCLRQTLERMLGEGARGECGRCAVCKGSVLPTLQTSPPVDQAQHRRPVVQTFSVGRPDSFGIAYNEPQRLVQPLTAKLGDFRRRC